MIKPSIPRLTRSAQRAVLGLSMLSPLIVGCGETAPPPPVAKEGGPSSLVETKTPTPQSKKLDVQ